MPDNYVTSRDMFVLVQELDRKISALVTQVDNLTIRAQEDREAVDEFCDQLEAVKIRVHTLFGTLLLAAGAVGVWANFNSIFG